ncbi:putative oxidoreductase C terminal-domain-containing protein [Myxozyma melibiosi]|uniref:Oxidoreductase C terminal-domain-containing protein n=1 Tax=Myxozyma melibiosi TaxID=54550 RepID=A0ABR1F267_9ASCO
MTLDTLIDILYIGAGNITFGNDNVLWNHSLRVERLLGPRLNVVAIIDPNYERYKQVLGQKLASSAAAAYKTTKYFPSLQSPGALDYLTSTNIDLFILGTPPLYRGTTYPNRDLELEILKHFGNKPTIFLEKPVAVTRPDQPLEVAHSLNDARLTIGVGYMMRYLKVVQKAKSIISKNNLTVSCIIARYANAYQRVRKVDWWTKSQQGGPIIEQATHFCDLVRYLGGEVIMESVKSQALEHWEPAGKLSHQCIDESAIPANDRIPRATTAMWKFESGAVGTLIHVVALHGIRFSNEITIYADGYQLRLRELYTTPTLYVRSPESDTEEKVYTYPGDDPFFNEMETFISVAAKRANKPLPDRCNSTEADEPPPAEEILTSYEDACKTFAMTWKIRDESEIKADYERSF